MNSFRLFLILLLVACALNSAFSAGVKLPASCRNAGDPLMDSPGLQFDMDPTPYCSISSGTGSSTKTPQKPTNPCSTRTHEEIP